MTARSTLLQMIGILRGYIDAGDDDYTIRNLSYWTDDQLETVMDRYRTDVYREPLAVQDTYTNGTVEYKEYYSLNYKWFEKTSGGTSIFYLENAAGSAIGTALYSVDYLRGHVTFASDTGGSAYYVYGRSYDLNAAAADVWRQKAAHYAGQVNFKTDNMSIDRGNLRAQALEMAAEYENRSGGAINVVTLYRSDWYGA